MNARNHLEFIGTVVVIVIAGVLNIYLISDQLYTIYVLLVGIPMAFLLSVFLHGLFAEDPGKVDKIDGERGIKDNTKDKNETSNIDMENIL